MQFSGLLSAANIVVAAAATTTYVSFGTGYDDASRSMTKVACSDGANGLIPKYHWQTQGDVSNFPFIGSV